MLFLWSVENLRVSKVNLSEPPDNDNFDALAQKTMHELDKEETSTKGKSNVGKERPISNEHPPQKSTLPSAKRQAPTTWTRPAPSASSSNLPRNRLRHSKKDRIQSKIISTAPQLGHPLRFRDLGRERKKRGEVT